MNQLWGSNSIIKWHFQTKKDCFHSLNYKTVQKETMLGDLRIRPDLFKHFHQKDHSPFNLFDWTTQLAENSLKPTTRTRPYNEFQNADLRYASFWDLWLAAQNLERCKDWNMFNMALLLKFFPNISKPTTIPTQIQVEVCQWEVTCNFELIQHHPNLKYPQC